MWKHGMDSLSYRFLNTVPSWTTTKKCSLIKFWPTYNFCRKQHWGSLYYRVIPAINLTSSAFAAKITHHALTITMIKKLYSILFQKFLSKLWSGIKKKIKKGTEGNIHICFMEMDWKGNMCASSITRLWRNVVTLISAWFQDNYHIFAYCETYLLLYILWFLWLWN